MEASKDYIKGFNNGYTIRQHAPDLAKVMIDKLDSSQDYLQGLKDGKLEYERELDKEILRWAEQHKDNTHTQPGKGNSMDKDKGEKDVDI